LDFSRIHHDARPLRYNVGPLGMANDSERAREAPAEE
jgi:hypothetical protein